jgi:kinesin family protein 5
MLRKIKIDYSNSVQYCALLEGEVVIWRSGGTVPDSEWVSLQNINRASSPSKDLVAAPSRPSTPSTALGSDERDEFLKRENEISDQLFSSQAEVKNRDAEIDAIKEELSFLKDRETSFASENKTLQHSVNEMRNELDTISFEGKDSVIMVDSLKDDNAGMTLEIKDLKVTLFSSNL